MVHRHACRQNIHTNKIHVHAWTQMAYSLSLTHTHTHVPEHTCECTHAWIQYTCKHMQALIKVIKKKMARNVGWRELKFLYFYNTGFVSFHKVYETFRSLPCNKVHCTYWREIKIAATKVNTVVIEGKPWSLTGLGWFSVSKTVCKDLENWKQSNKTGFVQNRSCVTLVIILFANYILFMIYIEKGNCSY